MNSLERRLQIGIFLSLVLLMGLLWVIGSQAVRGLTEDFVVSRLEHDAESLLAALEFSDEGARLRKRRLNPVFDQPFAGHDYVIRFSDGQKLVSRSLRDQTLSVPMVLSGETLRQHKLGPREQDLLLWIKGFSKQGQRFTLAVAEDLTSIQKHKNRFKNYFALLTLTGLFGLLLVQSLMLRSSFRRLDSVRDEIRQLQQGSREKLSEEVPKEIAPLVREVNQLQSLFTQRLERSRNALGNLAHALKGPLSILVQYLDNKQFTTDETQRQQAANQVERIRQLMERELHHARLAGKGIAACKFDPREELPDLVALLKQSHRKQHLDITYDVMDGLPVFGDREDMLELVGNLMDNACKWAKKQIHCSLTEKNNTICVVVEDDGPGLSEQALGKLVRRGRRLDESVEGHGLGLAIVTDIIKLYGGQIEFEKSIKLGGLRVKASLPLT